MLKKTIEFVDYNGVKRTEDHYFNLTKAELMKMEMGTTGGYTEMVQGLISAQDVPSIMKIFDEIIERSYGRKTPDGRGFEKSPEIYKSFKETEAYSELYVSLITDANEAAKFFNGIVPAELAEKVQAELAAQLPTT